MIEVHDLRLEQGAFRLGPLSFAVPAGAWALLTGASGVGKTSLLEALCGLRQSRGLVRLDDQSVSDLPPHRRRIGYVPQDGALFPAMTVREHLAFAARHTREKVDVAAIAHTFGLDAILARKPAGLSGGERQRVALARALCAAPKVLLLDEPISALDAPARREVADALAALRARRPDLTVLHVTHHQGEALRLADHRLRLENNQIHPCA